MKPSEADRQAAADWCEDAEGEAEGYILSDVEHAYACGRENGRRADEEETLALREHMGQMAELRAQRDTAPQWIRDNALSQWDEWKARGSPGTWGGFLGDALAASQEGSAG